MTSDEVFELFLSLFLKQYFSIKVTKHGKSKIILNITFGVIKIINENRNYNYF